MKDFQAQKNPPSLQCEQLALQIQEMYFFVIYFNLNINFYH
jgi:hypothetical protein